MLPTESKPFAFPHIRPSILFGLISFTVFRVLTGLVVFVATRVLPVTGRFIGPCSLNSDIELVRSGRFGYLLAAWNRWDTCHYLLIAANGYDGNVKQSVWPPLYPVLISTFGWAFKPSMLAALVVSNLAALACFILFYELVAGRWGDSIARKSVWLLAVYPMAFYLVAGYTESLALALSLACFMAVRDRSWLWAGLWAALATLTRMQGILLIVPILCVALYDGRQAGRKLPARLMSILAAAALPTLAFAGFSAYVRFGLGDPWPWDSLASFWDLHTGWPWEGFFGSLAFLVGHLPGRSAAVGFNYAATLANLALAALCVYWLIAGRKLPVVYQVYGWVMLLVPMLKVSDASLMTSVSRYTLSIFPIFIVQALRMQKRWVLWPFMLLSAAAQVVLLLTFYQWIWVA